MPTANQRLPVRHNVKHQKSPVNTIPAMPAPVSPGFDMWTAPNATESNSAAGQKPKPCASVNWTYPFPGRFGFLLEGAETLEGLGVLGIDFENCAIERNSAPRQAH